jgi:hypothetical protein
MVPDFFNQRIVIYWAGFDLGCGWLNFQQPGLADWTFMFPTGIFTAAMGAIHHYLSSDCPCSKESICPKIGLLLSYKIFAQNSRFLG